MSEKVSKSMKEVWEWKDAVYNDIKHLSPEEQIEYFRKQADEAIERYGLDVIPVGKGAVRFRKKHIHVVAEERAEYGTDSNE